MEVILSVEIRNTRKSSKLGQDEAIDGSAYGQCKTNCTKLNEFSKHQDKKQLKTTECNSSEKITYKIKAAEVGESWKRKAMEMFQSDPDYFDADSVDTKDDDLVYLKCGRCGQVFHNIDSFVLHKKECIRFRKKRRSRNEQGITMLYQRSENTLQTNSITEAASENQKMSLNFTQNYEESQGANVQTTSTKVRVRVKASEQSFSEISEQSTINRTWRLQMFSKEEVNLSKMGMIVLNTLTDVLYDLLKQDKPIFRPRIDCDITYLYSEHRKNNKHTPSNGWGGLWHSIQSTDIAVGDDIERIRLTRNELQHSRLHMLDDKRFAELSNIICELLKRFDIHNKPTRLYTDQLNEILAKTISADDVKAVEDALFGIQVDIGQLWNILSLKKRT